MLGLGYVLLWVPPSYRHICLNFYTPMYWITPGTLYLSLSILVLTTLIFQPDLSAHYGVVTPDLGTTYIDLVDLNFDGAS